MTQQDLSRRLEKRKRSIARRLKKAAKSRRRSLKPVLPDGPVRFELSDRVHAMPFGGLGAVHQLAVRSGLVSNINERVRVLKVHQPYHESDHVLNIAYNVFCGGHTLDDIELRRNDEVLLDALGVDAIPDPTTAGDFCRRFAANDVADLMTAINETRLAVWQRQGPSFRAQRARIDADGSTVPTTGECKEGMSLSYNGVWGYHPLVVSFANTGEPLFLVNRPGNRPSHEGAAGYLDQAVALCRRAGFSDVLLRGDTDFSQTQHLDRWHEDGVFFVFGFDANKTMKSRADGLDDSVYVELVRKAKRAFVEVDARRARPIRFKEQVVRDKGYRNIRLKSEDLASFSYQPGACSRAYRVVVVRKNLTIERSGVELFDEVRYFFYITNDDRLTEAQVVFEANNRCNQENLIAQLKTGVRALHAPVNTLHANWAYMVMAALAWSLKAWMALWLPPSAAPDEKVRVAEDGERLSWLRMDFRTFRNAVIDLPVQILRSGRQRIWRFLAWRPQAPTLLRLLDAL